MKTIDILRQYDGFLFRDYEDFESAILELFNRHLADFPPGYKYTQWISWITANGWVRYNSNGTVYVDSRGVEPAEEVTNIEQVKLAAYRFIAARIQYETCESDCWVFDEQANKRENEFGDVLESYIDQRINAALQRRLNESRV